MSRAGESKIAAERRLIVQNLANGAAFADVAKAFRRTDAEMLTDIAFVAQKIHAYCIRHSRQLMPIGDVGGLRAWRHQVLWILERLNLDAAPAFSKITIAPLDLRGLTELGRMRT